MGHRMHEEVPRLLQRGSARPRLRIEVRRRREEEDIQGKNVNEVEQNIQENENNEVEENIQEKQINEVEENNKENEEDNSNTEE